MDFSLSEEQMMLRQMAYDFLTNECPRKLVREMEVDERGYSIDLWRKMVGLGWTALPFPEKYGGGGGKFLDLVILLEEMGRACLPSPFIPSVVLGGLTILDIGTEEQKAKYLAGIISGNIICSLAWLERGGSYDPENITSRATATDQYYVISGMKLFVPDVHVTDHLLIIARMTDSNIAREDIVICLVDTKNPNISYVPLKTIVGDKQFEVNFIDVKVSKENVLGEPDKVKRNIQRILERAALAKCAEMVGGAQQALEMTINYAKERKQFGRPIGSFQVIQHYCANMATDVDAAKFNIYQAAWRLDNGLPCTKEIAIAKAWTSEAYRRVTALAHQIHGTIAFTKDLGLELYIRRAKASETLFGDADFYRELIAQQIGL